MLKVRITTEAGTPLVILGLTAVNVQKLQQGLPLVFPLSDIGVPGGGELSIIVGDDHADLIHQLSVAGVHLPPMPEPGPGRGFFTRG